MTFRAATCSRPFRYLVYTTDGLKIDGQMSSVIEVDVRPALMRIVTEFRMAMRKVVKLILMTNLTLLVAQGRQVEVSSVVFHMTRRTGKVVF